MSEDKAVITQNPTCQHIEINNYSGKCEECQEGMISFTYISDFVKTADNLLVGPHNTSGAYLADESTAKEVLLGFYVAYQCKRCEFDNQMTVYGKGPTIWPCGLSHQGDYIPAIASARVVTGTRTQAATGTQAVGDGPMGAP